MIRFVDLIVGKVNLEAPLQEDVRIAPWDVWYVLRRLFVRLAMRIIRLLVINVNVWLVLCFRMVHVIRIPILVRENLICLVLMVLVLPHVELDFIWMYLIACVDLVILVALLAQILLPVVLVIMDLLSILIPQNATAITQVETI